MLGLLIIAALTAQLAPPTDGLPEVPMAQRIFSIIPQPLVELWNAAGNINIGLDSDNAVTRRITEFLPKSGEDIGRNIGTAVKFLDRANQWFEDNIGIRFIQLFRLIGNFAIWILGGIAELIRIGISYVGE
ncbi:MAG: hypothetical protein Q8Q41_01425 [bacterium]|nr:hypothetical protein [bacterium]